MAQNSQSQKTGRRGEIDIRKMIEDRGFATSGIHPDFGEDFFVFGEDSDNYIEPFKIFFQVKASEQFDKYPSDWTEYVDTTTVRSWVLSNDLTVVVRNNLNSGEIKYCIPEDDIEYWLLDFTKDTPIRMEQVFNDEVVDQLMWMARIRHYDRIVRRTQPNAFESNEHQDLPQFRLFVFEFLIRLGLLVGAGEAISLPEDVRSLYLFLLAQKVGEDDWQANDDMTRHDVVRYATCVEIVPLWIYKVTKMPSLGISPFFADACACLLVQFIVELEDKKELPTT